MISVLSILSAVAFSIVSLSSYAADGDRCSPDIRRNKEAPSICKPVCAKDGLVFNGNWSNSYNHPPVQVCRSSGQGQAVCGCAATVDKCSSQKIIVNAMAPSVCNPVCAKHGLVFKGNWSDDRDHPPVQACRRSGRGQAVCECASMQAGANDWAVSPTIQVKDATTQLHIPIGLKKACRQGPDEYARPSDTCPIIHANGMNFWPLSYIDDRVGMAIVAYDSRGNIVGLIEKTGARYIGDITLDVTGQTISLKGQANNVITLKWNDLIVPQIANPMVAKYVLWRTNNQQSSWTNGVKEYGTTAPFGTGVGELLDPYVKHRAAKEFCAEKKHPWFSFASTAPTSPYLTVTCVKPPEPGHATYNVAMNTLISAAVNDHSLMQKLADASTEAELIAVAASNGYTITAADIAQSKGQASAGITLRTASSSNCGKANQAPCARCMKKSCLYWPFVYAGIKLGCSCKESSYSCTPGLLVNSNGICEISGICPSGQICKDFVVFEEYNDNGTDTNGVCLYHYAKCAKGIPSDALAAYEVVFMDGKAYYKSTNTLVNTWGGGLPKETLYVIDARDNKIYMVNVDERYIQVRGSANCLGKPASPESNTRSCVKPRFTTHAGILMGSVAGLPFPNSPPGPTVQQEIRVIGSGTIKVIDGEIQWITNDSGHFRPSQENLKNSIAAFKKAGFPHFPPIGGCSYNFQPWPGKSGVYRQNAIDGRYCENHLRATIVDHHPFRIKSLPYLMCFG